MFDIGQIFAERLNRLMEEHDDKAKDLASYLQVTEATVSRYRKGRLPDSLEILGKIADRYGKTIDYLVGRDLWGLASISGRQGRSLEEEAAKLGYTADDVMRILEALAAVQQRKRGD